MFVLLGLYLLVFIQSLLNIFIYSNNPLKHSNNIECYNLPCNIYSIYSSIILFTIDIILLGLLTYYEPLSEFLPKTWFLFYAFLGYLIIFLIHSRSKIIKKSQKINPPPEIILNKDIRFSIYLISLILYLGIIFIRYVRNVENTIELDSILNKYFWNRFGGFKNNKINFTLSYLTIIAIPISILRILDGSKYHPSYYNLPLSWKI